MGQHMGRISRTQERERRERQFVIVRNAGLVLMAVGVLVLVAFALKAGA